MFLLNPQKYSISQVACWVTCLCLQATPSDAQDPFAATFESIVPSEIGIDFRHSDGGSGNRYIMETVFGGLASFDYDGDGLVDLYVVSGVPLKGNPSPKRPSNRLYRNLGGWKFQDVTESAGLLEEQYGMGVVVADYNEDGQPDLFLSNFGRDALYRNNGDGSFEEVSLSSGLSTAPRFGAGSAFLDMDGDGDLDLYTASYVEFDYQDHRTRTIAGVEFHVGPNDFSPAADRLYRNNGSGQFEEVSEAAGLSELRAPGMAVLAADFDRDGDVDIFVANDQQPNFLLSNDGTGKFEDDGWLAGVAVDRVGKMNGNMGVEYADIDGNGCLDVLTTTYQEEMPVLYLADTPGLFRDATNVARIDPTLTAHVSWGVGAVDFDHDGDRDIFLSCGHFLDNIQYIDDRTSVRTPNYLMANDGRGRFSRVSLGSNLKETAKSSRGAVFDDLDNDGDLDVVVLNANDLLTLLRTNVPGERHWRQIRLIGTASNRDALGAFITVSSPRKNPSSDGDGQQTIEQVHELYTGRGYESYYGSRVHFGAKNRFDRRIRVQWPSGETEEFESESNQPVLVQGTGRALVP